MAEMDYLNQFEKRMKNVGRFAVLFENTTGKTTWNKYKIETMHEKINLVFSVLLCMMEYSLREEPCTIDVVVGFLEDVDVLYFRKNWSRTQCRDLADFIVNRVLSNDGQMMTFQGYNYTERTYQSFDISYIANRVIDPEDGVRRIAYYLTEDGYNMMLSTMEVESHLKITIHEMLFKLHMEKADYSHAVDDVKHIFEGLRIQNQKTLEAMNRIRKNALHYTVEEYQTIVEENLEAVEKSRDQFRLYRENVDEKIKEFQENEMTSNDFAQKEKQNLEHLRKILQYLEKAIDEHQRLLNDHFDMKHLYDRELKNYAGMTMIQRFDFRAEIYNRVLQDIGKLDSMPELFGPLFFKKPKKYYNMEKVAQPQQKIRKETDEEEEVLFDRETYAKERQERHRLRLLKYEQSLAAVLEPAVQNGRVTLRELSTMVEQETDVRIRKEELFPTVEIFREIMIELLAQGTMDMEVLKKEKNRYFMEMSERFQLNEMLLFLVEKRHWGIHTVTVHMLPEKEKVVFPQVRDEFGKLRTLTCANIEIIIQ